MKVRRMHRSFMRRLRGIHGMPAKATTMLAEKQNEPSDRTARAYDKGSAYSSGRAGRCGRC